MELRFNVEDRQINELQQRMGIESRAEVCRQSLAMMNWATTQAEAGRQIVALDGSGNQVVWPLRDVIDSARW